MNVNVNANQQWGPMHQITRKEGKMSRYPNQMLTIVVLGAFLLCLPAAWAGERFIDNGDGTVTDQQRGIMWAKTDNLGNIDWIQAEKWVQYTFPDTLEKKYDNWRLPTLEELKSLVNPDKNDKGYETDCGQRVKIIPQIQLTCGWVWASEEVIVSKDPKGKTVAPTARIFNFDNKYHYTARKAHKRGYRALAVRDLK
jgi:hypothetical protein